MLTNLKAIQLIQKIQKEEGFDPCFKTRKEHCPYEKECCWAQICLEKIKPLITFKIVK